jgi:hypothetical protein
MYRSQVDRVMKEIADLQKKAADENAKVTSARGDALRVASSISRTASVSSLQQKQREIQRYEKKASDHEKRAAQHVEQLARKRSSLSSAESSLQRAQTQERQKEGRDAKRKREQELRDIRELERLRRSATQPFPEALMARPPVSYPDAMKPRADEHEFDVCLSFATENRDYVEMVAGGLKEHGVKVFYDDDEKVRLWGKDLAEFFDRARETRLKSVAGASDERPPYAASTVTCAPTRPSNPPKSITTCQCPSRGTTMWHGERLKCPPK